MRVTTLELLRSRMRLATLVAIATLCMAAELGAWSLLGQDANRPAQPAAQAPMLSFDYEDSSSKDAFRFWSAAYPQPIRGIVVLVPGANYDGRPMANDGAWQAFAQEHRLALVSCFIIGSDPTEGSGDALERAIATFAKQSSHSELPHAPLLMYGESAGGQFNYNFVFWKPTRVMAFIVNKGGFYNDESPDPRVYAVPGLFFLGMNDSKDRIGSITKIWTDGRRQGALWALAPQPNSNHEFSKTAPVARTFFEAILTSRLPNPAMAVDGAVDDAHMKPMLESQGWIGDLTTHEIRPAGAEEKFALDSAWLPDQTTAVSWQSFVSVPQLPTPNRLVFEVASIKPVVMDASHPFNPGHFWAHVSQARASYWSMTVGNLIDYAYDVESFQVTGPDWTNADHFDVDAVIAEGTNKEDDRWMLQALLKDRFKLAFHIEKRELEGYALAVGKYGAKLTPSLSEPARPATDTPLQPGETSLGEGRTRSKMTKNSDGSSTIDMGKRGTQTIKFDQESWAMHYERSKMTTGELAGRLSGCLGSSDHKVEDQTGIKGNYQVAYDCPMKTPRPTKDTGAGDLLPSDPQGSSLLTRSLDALGLKLEKRKILMDVYVIDHIERPSEN